MNSKKAVINNLTISYLDNELNTGKVLFFVHGWGADKYNLQSVYNPLLNLYRIISIDLPGFGESAIPTETIGSHEYSEIIYNFLISINIKTIIYIGHSFGGKIGILLSVSHPDIVEKLILMNSGGLRSKRNFLWHIKVYSFKLLKKLYTQLYHNEEKLNNLRSKFGSDDYRNAGEMRNILVKTTAEDLSGILSQIKCPVFLYWGEKDNATPVWMAKKMKKMIKDSGLYIVKKGSHFSFIDDNRIISIIKSFAEN